MNGERGMRANAFGVFAKQSQADMMESTRPGEFNRSPVERLASDTLGTTGHLLRGAAGESEQEDALGIDAVGDQVSNPIGQGPVCSTCWVALAQV